MLSQIQEMDLLLAKIMYDIKTKQKSWKIDVSLTKLIKEKYTKISSNVDIEQNQDLD